MVSLQGAIGEKVDAFGAPSRMSAAYATELLAGRLKLERSVSPGAVA